MPFRMATWLVSLAFLLTIGLANLHAQPFAPSRRSSPPPPPPLTVPSPPAVLPSPGTLAPTPLPPPQAAGTAPATITLQVPTNAAIWFGEQQMTQSGPARTFRSPAIEVGKAYTYKIKVSWPAAQGQQPYSGEQEITVRGGQTTIVDFTPLSRAPAMVGQPPTPPTRPTRPSFIRPTSGQRP